MSERRKHLEGLTGLRGIAALWVALFHAAGPLGLVSDGSGPLDRLIGSGWLGVDLFFVLSGFVMCYAHQEDFRSLDAATFRHFVRLRLARIYPVHLAVCLLWVPPVVGIMFLDAQEEGSGIGQSYNWLTFSSALLLLNGWGLPGTIGWNLPSWSVSSEWFAYLVFPFIAVALNRVRSAVGFAVVASVVLSATTWLALSVQDGRQYMLPESWMLVRVCSEFVFGCCIYGLWQRKLFSFGGGWFPTVVGVALIVGACSPRPGVSDVLLIVLFGLLIGSVAENRGALVRVLGGRVLVFLGEISYSIYLVHALVLVCVKLVADRLAFLEWGTGGKLAALFAYLLVIVVASVFLYRYVEVPGRALIREGWSRDRASTGSARAT